MHHRKESRMKHYKVERTVSEHHGVTLLQAIHRSDGTEYALHSCNVDPDYAAVLFEPHMVTFSKFSSPFLLNITSWIQEDKKYWIIREWSDHPSLREHVASLWKEDGQIKESSIWDIVTTTCLSLYFLHMNGVVHYHLTMDNIFVESSMLARISDFNHYRWHEDPDSMGPFYIAAMAPELFHDHPTYTPKSDLWALGCILYEIVMQKPPFYSDDSSELRRLIEEEDPQPLPRWISPDLSTLIYSLLNKDPMERPNIESIMQLPKPQQRLGQIVPKLFPQMGELLREQKSAFLQLETVKNELAKYEGILGAIRIDPSLQFPIPPYPPEWQRKREREKEKERALQKQRNEEERLRERAEAAAGKDGLPSKDSDKPKKKDKEKSKKDEGPSQEELERESEEPRSEFATERDISDAVRYLVRIDHNLKSQLPRLTPSQMSALTLWKGMNTLTTKVRDVPLLGLRHNIKPLLPENAKIRIEGNRLSTKQNTPLYIKLDPLIKSGIWRLDMGYVASVDTRWIGICDADFEFPENYEVGQDSHTAGYLGHTGGVWHNGKWRVGNHIYHDADVVGVEVNYDAEPPTCHFLLEEQYQPISFKFIPNEIRFFFCLQDPGTTVELLCLSRPYAQFIPPIEDSAQLAWARPIPPRQAKPSKKFQVEVKEVKSTKSVGDKGSDPTKPTAKGKKTQQSQPKKSQ
ncbi:putative serine/threonine protein kinase [Blattamonas nauphoetae]|uniref:Serine/threonine protein kinase n=1 Tax=Blattamonas nauphoetae TaxID=2049346 RepID=A0ABQ9XRD2_9EUKA|nr:putative serine/threonine protein kinase [Blattamonas nauphoetae]